MEKAIMKNIVLILFGVFLLFGSIAATVGRRDMVVNQACYAPWYVLCGYAYAFPSVGGACFEDIKYMQNMDHDKIQQ